MANTLITTDLVARDASVMLKNNLVMANLTNRNHEDKFAQKVGDTIEIKTPPVQVARDFIVDGSVQDNAIVESSVDLKLSEQPYVAHTLTSAEKTLELDAFALQVTKPAMDAVAQKVDAFIAQTGAEGFAPNYVGGEGSDPSTVLHIVAARKKLQDQGAPLQDRVSVISTQAEASFLALDQFTSADYEPSNNAIKNAILGRKYGIDLYSDQNVDGLSLGDASVEATALAAATVIGESTVSMDKGGANATGTIPAGSRFTVAGDLQVYTVTADSVAAAGPFTVAITPASKLVIADAAAVTWKAASKGNLLYVRNSLASAIVAPAPLAIGSSSAIFEGIGIRVSMSSSTSALTDQIVFDTYCGAQVIEVDGGCVYGGA